MEKVLFTRQRHEADRAGLHWDYRLVVGDKAHSWATKKELPEPGKQIILWQQPVHTADYALSKKVVIPKGQYGAGVTTLDWVKKGNADLGKDKITIDTDDGKFLLKKMPDKYGKGAWLFKNLGKENMEKKAETGTCLPTSWAGMDNDRAIQDIAKVYVGGNRYLQKIASDIAIAKKSRGEEEKAIHDYSKREKEVKNPVLEKALKHARGEEKEHAKLFSKAEKAIEKKAALNTLIAKAKRIVTAPGRAAKYEKIVAERGKTKLQREMSAKADEITKSLKSDKKMYQN